MSQVFEQVTHRPDPPLASLVEKYVGYRMAGFEPGVHAGLPSRSLTFIVSFDDPVDMIGAPGPTQAPGRFGALVGGLHSSPATIRHDGNQHGVQLDVTPLGARALFGLPAGALVSTVVTLDEVLGPVATELIERLEAATSWTERFAVLDDVLWRAATDVPPLRPEVSHAWDLVVASDGATEVHTLAREVGWSRRHLTERFQAEFGLAPKVLSRVVRFERARRMLGRAPLPLAQVAAACGYTDQAHMTREWQRLAGASPRAWLVAENLPFVQDDEMAVEAG